MSLADRITEVMASTGKTNAVLAAEAGVSAGAVTQWSKGSTKTLKAETALKLQRATGFHAEWLVSGKGPKMVLGLGAPPERAEIDLENHPDVQPIPTVTLRLRAGIHGFAVDGSADLGAPLFVPSEWMRRKGFKQEQLLGLPVQGDSMEPTLSAGDKIVINTHSTEPKDGKIFAINYEGEAIIKRLHRDRGQWWLGSDNLDQLKYPRKLCADAGCLLLGELVFRQTENF